MIAFKDLLGCEIYKVNRKHTLLKLGIAILIIIAAMTAFYAVVNSLIGDYTYSEFSGSAQEYIEMIDEEIAAFEAGQTWLTKMLPNQTLYNLKAQRAMYQYLADNGIATNGVTSFGGTEMFTTNFYGFTETCMSVVMAIVTIFAVVACCRTTTSEYASGALKMQFIRPINKNKFFTAKWLSVFLISEIYLIIGFIVSFLLGVIVYGASAPSVIMVLNASKVVMTSAFGALTLGMFFNTVTLFMAVQVTMFLCSLSKTPGKALVLGLLLVVFGIGEIIEEILAIGYVGFIGFFSNLNWASALTLAGPAFKGMSLATMVPFTLVWCALFMFLSYKRFNKLEV